MAMCHFLLRAKEGRKHGLCFANMMGLTSAHTETHACSHTHTHTQNVERWPRLSQCNAVTLWSCVRLLLGNSPPWSSQQWLLFAALLLGGCPGLMAHCFHTPPHTTAARLLVPFELRKQQSSLVGRDLSLCCSAAYYGCNVQFVTPRITCCW